MAVTTFDLTVHYEDGAQVSVRADQRDIAAFELKYHVGLSRAMSEMTATFFRFLGWAALRRTGKLDLQDTGSAWDAWDKRVIEVEPTDDQEEADPGSPAAPAEA